jgi:glycosyltransferase involved in cell wall biosynthesis
MPDRAPSIAVAIPAYNAERFLADALASILAQTRPVDEIVVVDDGSSDRTAEVAAAHGARVLRQPNAGIGATRSRAVAATRTDLVVLLDADDLLTPNSIECRIRELEADPELEMLFGHVRHFAELADGSPVALDQPQAGRVIGGLLIRRAAYDRVGPFASGLRVAEALDWMLRAGEQAVRELTVPDQVLWRRVHGANNSIANRDSLGEFTRALKASLDRRRADES